MINLKKNILVTGGNSRFCKHLKKSFFGRNIFYSNKKNLNILDFDQLLKVLREKKIKIFIHVAALSRPMNIHDKNPCLSIETNIIGTANVARACKKLNIKLIYFSTNYVYPCKKGNYKETDGLLPINNYAWSKLGGECAVQLLKDSLILRLAMTDYPFAYKSAIRNAYSSFIYNRDFAKLLPYLLNERGIINIGKKRQSILDFAKKDNPKIKGIKILRNKDFPIDSSINVSKFNNLIKKYVKKSSNF